MTSVFDRLRRDAAPEWQAFVWHRFVKGIANGSLPQDAFKHYLRQDYLFLRQFARACALAAFKAETIADMRAAVDTMRAIIDIEMRMHVRYCAGWGISETELETSVELEANIAYTRYVFERGLTGDSLDLHTALAPCVIGYAEIGASLTADEATKRSGHPYAEWIATYAGDEYQAIARTAIDQLDRLYASRGGEARYASLLNTFRTATRLEAGFWQMALDAAGTSQEWRQP